MITLAMIQLTIVIKGILIHQPERLMEVSDNEVLVLSWIVSFILAIIRFLIDYNLPERSDPLQLLLMGPDIKT